MRNKKRIFALVVAITFILSLINFTPALALDSSDNGIKGSLVIVGGALGSSNKEIYNEFIKLAGGKEKAKIGIIPAASSKPSNYGNAFKEDLIKYGVSEENVDLIKIALRDDKTTEDIDESTWIDNVNKDEIVNELKECTGIWFVGGDQARITEALLNEDGTYTKSLKAIWDIYKDGAVIGGTSAGAAIMSDPMLLDGDSLGALKEVEYDSNKADDLEYQAMDMVKGIGFFNYGLVDQHFDKRARFGRLIVAISKENKYDIGYGIDENTAMIVDNVNKKATSLGAGGITVMDLSKARRNKNSHGFDMDNINVSYITTGDSINLETHKITIKEGKYDTKGYEYYNFKAPEATGVLTGRGTLKDFLSYNLLDNEAAKEVVSYVYDNNGDGFKLIFKETEESNGYWCYMDGNKDSYSGVNVRLDIKPVKVQITPDNKKAKEPSKESVKEKKVLDTDIQGSLVIVGGALGSTNKEVYDRFINLSGGTENAKIGIIPSASSKLDSSEEFKKDLVTYGVKEENIEVIPLSNHDFGKTDVDESVWLKNSNSDEIVEKIKGLTGIWFVGGDQTRITGTLFNEDGSNSKALDALWVIYKEGGVIGGTSAGAAIMSDVMIAGGSSLGALSKGLTEVYEDESDQEAGALYLEKGLGFFQYGIVDQHFDGKARLGRLIVTALDKGYEGQLSYGVDEDTAMIFNGKDKTISVAGRGGVTIIDLSKASKDLQSERTSIKEVNLSHIKPGDTFNVTTKEFNINEDKLTTVGYEYGEYKPAAVTGVFSSRGMWKDFIAYSLVDNYGTNEVKSYCFDENEGFEIVFKQEEDSEGYWAYTDGNIDDYSTTNVYVDINPVNVNIKDYGMKSIIYTVQPGDYLKKIAKKYGTNYKKIAEDNNIKNPNLIFPEQQLLIYVAN